MGRRRELQPDNRGWFTIGEASQFLGVSANTLRLWANDGVLKSYRTAGNHRRFRRSDLLAFLAREIPDMPTAALH